MQNTRAAVIRLTLALDGRESAPTRARPSGSPDHASDSIRFVLHYSLPPSPLAYRNPALDGWMDGWQEEKINK